MKQAYRRLTRWFNHVTFGWTLTRRLFTYLLVIDLLVIVSVSLINAVLPDTLFGQRTITIALLRLVSAMAIIGLSFGLMTVIAVLNVKGVAQRVEHVSKQVENQLLSGDIDIAVSPEREDEVGRLIRLLNELGQAYRTSMQTLARRADEMAMLDLVATTINRTLDLQEVLDTSLREALKTVKWDAGAIYMWDDRNESLNMVSFRGLTEDTVRRNITYKLGESIIGLSAGRREVLTVGPQVEPRGLPVSAAPGWPATQISLPLVTVPGHLLGTLIVATDKSDLVSPDELSLLETLSAQIALAIDKAQLYTQVSDHAEELERIVAARTDQLSQAIEELWIALKQAREADRVKSLLLSTVSHELRTPLATIKGNTSLLIEHHDRIPMEQLVEHLTDIEEETDKLTELISNLLEMSRIESGSLHMRQQDLDLTALLRAAVSAAAIRHKEHTLIFASSAPTLVVSGDPRRIDQIISNLADNAAKYSPPHSTIEVYVETTPGEAVVAVKDQGIGIAADNREKIFDRFFQVKSGDSVRQGIGLGLAICRGLVEAQGGRIWVESDTGHGSTFYFSLPLKNAVHRSTKRNK